MLLVLRLANGLEAPNTISLNFERKVTENKSTEIVKGVAYYQSPQKLFIQVNDPIKQKMIIEGNIMLIYYPEEGKAIRIKSKGLIPMPMVQTILSIMKDDYGLTEMGYSLKKHDKKDNVLYTHWDPPKKLRKYLGEFVLGTTDDLLISTETKDPEGRTILKSSYKKYVKIAGGHFPMEIHSEIHDGTRVSGEDVTYSNLKLNAPIPREIADFKLPKSVPIQEIEW